MNIWSLNVKLYLSQFDTSITIVKLNFMQWHQCQIALEVSEVLFPFIAKANVNRPARPGMRIVKYIKGMSRAKYWHCRILSSV